MAIDVAVAVTVAISVSVAVANPLPHLAAVDRRGGVALESEPDAAPLDFEDGDLEEHPQILAATDDDALAILPGEHEHGTFSW